jgi:micrococcal nuclease
VARKRKAFAMSRRRRNGIIVLCLAASLIIIGADRVIVHPRVRRLLLPEEAAASSDHARYNGREFAAIRVIDGDTLDIDSPDADAQYTRIRLLGIDTPETKGAAEPMYFGLEASAFARESAEGRKVRVYLPAERTRDYYGRLLAYVKLPDGGFLNEMLIVEGYAYADTRFEHELLYKYRQLESMARSQDKGLWKNVTDDKMPQWRRK